MNMPEIENKNVEFSPNLPPEEQCLLALLDLNQFQEPLEHGKPVGNFYAAYTGTETPHDLRTRISVHPGVLNSQEGSDLSVQSNNIEDSTIAATIVVDFTTSEVGVRRMLNLDFVKTPDGLRLMQRERIREGDDLTTQYTRTITDKEMAALSEDAVAIREIIIEEDVELMKLGPLVEGQSEDGSRRFHIGDILSVVSGRLVSPRGLQGVFDILEYMTDDSPNSIQLGRFTDECRPYLEGQLGNEIGLEIPDTIDDNISLYKWLATVTKGMDGDPFLKVGKVNETDHAVIDPETELVLDYGPEILKKVTKSLDEEQDKHDTDD